jgi:hypothetical protein
MAAKTLRQRARAALRSKEDRLLIETGFTYESGALTKDGRKVVLDLLFKEDDELRTKVLNIAQTLEDADKK